MGWIHTDDQRFARMKHPASLAFVQGLKLALRSPTCDNQGFSVWWSWFVGLLALLWLLSPGGGVWAAEERFSERDIWGWPKGKPFTPAPPIRLRAIADVNQVAPGRYTIREALDVANDDRRRPLEVRRISADTWTGHRLDALGETWHDFPMPFVVPPDAVSRVAERVRTVVGRPRRDWWVRWLRFTIETDRGTMESNFISSPLERPRTHVESVRPGLSLDSPTEPGHRHRP
jgi:hypothetical protein